MAIKGRAAVPRNHTASRRHTRHTHLYHPPAMVTATTVGRALSRTTAALENRSILATRGLCRAPVDDEPIQFKGLIKLAEEAQVQDLRQAIHPTKFPANTHVQPYWREAIRM